MTAPDRPIAENKPLISGRRLDMTMLYRSTDRLCRRGAPMENLAHSASFDSKDKDATCALAEWGC
jgi:hypothetical protein